MSNVRSLAAKKRRARLAVLVASGMMAALITPVVVDPSVALASTDLLNESFLNSTVTDPAFSVVGNGTSLPCLTAVTTTPAGGTIPACPDGQVDIPAGGDGEGNGALRLTDNGPSESGALLYNKALPLAQGADISFDYAMYGGTNGLYADGINLFLADGATPITATGAAGGSLGYAQKTNVAGAAPGLTNGFLGLGLDEYGNYELDTEGRGTTGGSATTSGTSACTPTAGQTAAGGVRSTNQVGLRGPGNGYDGYCLLDSVDLNNNTESLHGLGTNRLDLGTHETVRIVIDPSTVANPKVTVYLAFNQDNGDTVAPTQVFQTLEPANAPPTFRFGVAASTGGKNDIHEIFKLNIKTVNTEPTYSIAQSDTSTQLFTAGGTGTFTVTPTLVSGSADPDAPTVVETLPTGLTLASVPTPAGYTCTGTVGSQTVSCTYTGTLPIAVGTVLPSISIPVNVSAASGQFTASAVTNSVDSTPGTAGTDTVRVLPKATPGAVTVADGSATPSGTAVPAPTGTGKFTYTIATGPNDSSSFQFNPDGTFSYTPKTPFSGTGTAADSFTYTVTDASGGVSAPVTETLNVTPTGVADTYFTPSGTTLAEPASTGVLANDLGTGLTATAGTLMTSQGGTVTLAADGSFSYVPPAGVSTKADSFTYTLTDAYNQSTTATATISVTPIATPDKATVGYQSTTTPATGLLANDVGTGLTVTSYTQPNSGTVKVNPNGTYTYTAAAGYSGQATFSYTVTDASGQTASSTDTITILPPGPVGTPDTGQTTVGQPLQNGANLLANDIGTGPLTATKASDPGRGTVTVNSNGTYVYTPAAGFSGTDVFTYTVTDADGQQSAPTTVTIKVLPQAAGDSIVVTAGQSLSTKVPTPAGTGPFTYAGPASTKTPHGTVSFNPDGTYTYTPDSGYVGNDSFTYTTTDASGLTSAPATVTITVKDPPPPVAVNDTASTLAGQPVSSPNLLANDRGTGPLTATKASDPTNGKVTVNPDGTYTYTPAAGFSGTDTFTYTTTDAVSQVSPAATVTITVSPVANADSASGTPAAPVTGNVLNNDVASGITTGQATATLVTGPAHGTLTLNPDGSFTYTATPGYTGASDTFTYTVTDKNGLVSNTATVTITLGTPPAPVAVNDTGTTTAGTPLSSGTNLQANDSGTGTLTSTGVSTTTAEGGTVTVATDGSYVYTPPAGFSGVDTFQYADTDAFNGTSNVATATITVLPAALPDSANLTGGSTYAGKSVLSNDTGTLLTAVLVTGPTHGRLTLNPDGTYSYTPVLGYSGPDSFTYVAKDPSTNSSAVTTVTLNVSEPPAPVAAPDAATTPAGATLTNGTNLLDNDMGTVPLTAVKVSSPAHGTVTVNPDGTYIYTPTPGYSGPDSFTYQAKDPYGQLSNVVAVSISVIPVVSPDSKTVTAGTTLSATIPTPVGSGPFAAAVVAPPAHGTLTLNPDGTYSYTPAPGYVGVDSFSYDVTDPANGTSTPATITLTVVAPTGPTGAPDAGLTPAGIVLHGSSLLANDTGAGPLVATGASSPSHGTVVVNPDGTYTYIPAPGFSGVDSFTYTITDAYGQVSLPVTVTVTVTPKAAPDAGTTTEGAVLHGSSVLSNDMGVGLTAALATGPTHGTLGFNPDGTYTYTPAPGYAGPDSFTYVARDAAGNTSAPVTVSLTVTPAVPVITGGTKQTVVIGGTLAPITYTDASGVAPVVTATGKLPPGVKLGPTGDFTGTPTTAGTYKFTVTVRDPAGGFTTATVTIVVQPVPVSPIAKATVVQTSFVQPNVGGTISAVKGSLPPGITLKNGKLVGTSTRIGTYVVTITVKTKARTITRRLTITVTPVKPVQSVNHLAFTGAPVAGLLTLSLLLLILGTALVACGARRRRRA